jgi:hypothetical protein
MEPEIILIVRRAESLMIEPCGASRAVIMNYQFSRYRDNYHDDCQVITPLIITRS